MIDYRSISNKRQFKSATGKSKQEFELIKSDLECYYFEKYGQTYEEYIEENVYELPTKHDWFRNVKMLVDLGFVGIDKIYNFKELIIGEKKRKKSKSNPNPKLSDEQKELNKKVSKERIFVEHAIGGMKIYRI